MKTKILELLLQNRDNYISGEQISEIFGVSRTAVWKHIKKLRQDGYNIESISSKGYRLIDSYDILSSDELNTIIKSDRHSYNFIYEKIVTSTSDLLKSMESKLEDWSVIIAEEQTAGRGRLGRTWISKRNKGIYMSILLRPNILPNKAMQITQIAAASLVLAIREIFHIDAMIKWPNDIVINGKKVCGILTEMSAELNQIRYISLGIGINVNDDIFDEEIKSVATSLKLACNLDRDIDRKQLLKKFYKYFDDFYFEYIDNDNLDRVMNICREYSAIKDKYVTLIERNKTREVYVLDLDDKGQLLVRNEGGENEVIISGEVSIRGDGIYGKVL